MSATRDGAPPGATGIDRSRLEELERGLEQARSQGAGAATGGEVVQSAPAYHPDDEHQVGRIHVIIENVPGSLGGLTTLIGKNKGNISNLKITNRSSDFFEMLVDIEVTDVKHLTDIIAALRATPIITSVERARG